MAERKYIAFGRPSEPTIIQELSYVLNGKGKGITVGEISKKLQIDHSKEFLAISTPIFREKLPSKRVPLDFYPQLIQTKRPGKYLRPQYFIAILPKEQKKFTSFIAVKTECNDDIPPFEVSFKNKEFEGKTYQDFQTFVESNFPFNHTNGSLLIGENPVNLSDTISDLISILKKEKCTFSCILDSKDRSKVNHRANIVAEIQSTEETYLKTLEIITDYWQPKTREQKVFTEAEADLIYRDFPAIINCHQTFLQNLQQRGASYGAMLSDVFIDFSAFFKVSLLYISNYSTIINIILEKSKIKDIDNKLQLLASKNPNEIKGNLQAFLITPVQRMPRYILFLRELLKYTPPSHPDSSMLLTAYTKVEEVTHQIEQASITAENNEKLLTIQFGLVSHFDVLRPSRVLLQSYPIEILKPKQRFGTFYLFNDLILITKEVKGGNQVILDDAPTTFGYVIRPRSHQITVMGYRKIGGKKNIAYSFVLTNKEQHKELINKLSEMKDSIFKDEPDKYFEFFKAENIESIDGSPKLYGHDSISVQNKVFVFGGQTPEGYNSNMIIFNINDSNIKLSTIPTSIPARTCHTMTRVNNSIYIFGGYNENEFLTDFWEYTITDNESTILSNSNLPRTIAGHSTIYFPDISKLYVFGGMNRQKKLMNEMLVFDIKTGNWDKITSKNEPPTPRMNHSATLINQSIYVHGGFLTTNEKEVSSDIYIYDIFNNEWTTPKINGDKVLPRANHKALQVGHYIIFIGGTDSLQVVPPAILDTKQLHYTICNTEFNDYKFLTKFCMDVIGNQFFVYGGYNFVDKEINSNVYYVNYPNFLSSSNRIHHKKIPNKKVRNQTNSTIMVQKSNTIRANGRVNRQRSNLLKPKDQLKQLELLREQLNSDNINIQRTSTAPLIPKIPSATTEISPLQTLPKSESNEMENVNANDENNKDNKPTRVVKRRSKQAPRLTKEDLQQIVEEAKDDEEKKRLQEEEKLVKAPRARRNKDGRPPRKGMNNENIRKSALFSLNPEDFADYNEEEFCKGLNIKFDQSPDFVFQEVVLSRKLLSLWLTKKHNEKMRVEIQNRIENSNNVIDETKSEVFIKLNYNHKCYLQLLSCNTTVEEVKEKFQTKINAKISKLYLSEDQQNEVTDETLSEEIKKFMYKIVSHVTLVAI
ncbi:Kelch motif family protein [Histomonas meleagridis]|uniref:Kelch motif family protein n=1 Tax=Histomonas meleagridis TaxID=135588 RepID=UPI00355A3BAC|nr:Kelch motif family protein [Histomonas meleagridis]KAH0803453.1 Kelch motif family protein [Histomonas meleagridis]